MTPGARLAAAIDIFADIDARRRPAADALKDYGLAHRFAGSKDRAAIAALVYDALRVRASAAWIAADDTPRAILLGALRRARHLDVAEIEALCSGEGHAPPPLDEAERAALGGRLLGDAPDHVQGDFPDWLQSSLSAAFGAALRSETQAMAVRAPLDLRVNTIKATRERAAASLSHLEPRQTAFAPSGLRLTPGADGRTSTLAGEPAFAKGWVEVQDEGSQLAAILARPTPGAQVLDLCAGGGGKTLAMAALMENKGQIYATDTDGRRLAGLFPRLEKSGARNVQVRPPRGGVTPIADLEGNCDLVLVDAPCTGTGTWRRHPDAKWRIRPGALEQRVKAQDEVLAAAARYVKPGGRLVYVTCSVLPEENDARVAAFAARSDFEPEAPAAVAEAAGLPDLAPMATSDGLLMTPLRTGTDGFYVASLKRM